MLSKDLSFDMSLVLNGLGRAKKAPIDDVFNNNIHSALTLSFQAGDIFGFHKTLERTLAAIPLRGWRALHQWARQSGHPIPDTFAFGAMLEAALIGDTLPAEPADLRRAILELDPKDANSWWRVMFPTGVYIRRSASFLAARLVEQHLGTTWATSLQSFDATQWDIPHYTAMPNTVPSWITRTPEVCERSWSTMIFWANTIRYWQNSFAATKTEYGILFLEKSLIFGESGVVMIGNRRPAGYGIRFLGHDYNAISLMDIIDLTLDNGHTVVQVAPLNIVLITDPFSANYYHSLLDYAGRLAEVEFLVRDHDYLIGIPPSHASIMIPILDALGFGESVYPLDRAPTAFDTVAVAAAPQVEQFCHPATIRWLHDRVQARITPSAATRLLLSRRDASQRRLINEAALSLALEPFGVRVIVPGALTPAEQLALFAAADVIIAPHGAGLANLIACRPGTKVIEIAAEFEPTMFFTSISNLLRLDHVLVQATAKDTDLLVSIDDVLAALEALGVAPAPKV